MNNVRWISPTIKLHPLEPDLAQSVLSSLTSLPLHRLEVNLSVKRHYIPAVSSHEPPLNEAGSSLPS